jgi:hypothetical protein
VSTCDWMNVRERLQLHSTSSPALPANSAGANAFSCNL